MSYWFRSILGFTFLTLLLQLTGFGDDAKPPVSGGGVTAADQLYRAGKFADAESAYQALIDTDPKLISAQVGLVKAMLKEQKIDESLDAVQKALHEQPDSAALLAAQGDVQFRRGEMSAAEISYMRAKAVDAKEVHSYLGLARLYASYSLYRKAYDQLLKAHELAPNDIEVQRAWLRMLPRKERMAALEVYLGGPHPDDEDDTKWMAEYLDFLKATADKPVHRCRLVSKVESTATKLQVMYTEDRRRIRGIGLTVKLNDHNSLLLLDTGAGGIMVGRKQAEKAHLTRISAQHYGGIGDKGLQSGYTAVADRIRIGELEFEDCVISVSDKNMVADEDGLIGADVFGSYLVDLDLPGMQLNLSPLPKRPEDTVAPTSLNSEGEEQARAEQKDTAPEESTRRADNPSGTATTAKQQPSVQERLLERFLPKDRYVAPEMASWTKVFHFGHTVLVPTVVNDSKPMLFGLDTGAFANILSVRAGRQVGKVSLDSSLRIRGLSGEVNKVYSASKATLRFGHLQQTNLDMITLDLSTLSRHMGTEISGFLGFNMLRALEVKVDYRDGLVDFVYDPNKRTIFTP